MLIAVLTNDINRLTALYTESYERPHSTANNPTTSLTLLPSLIHASIQHKHYSLLPLLLQHENANETDLVPPFCTPLHLAAQHGEPDLITLLLEAGADPTLKDSKSQTAYNVCKTKECRSVLRRYAGLHPDQWKYDFPVLTENIETEAEDKKRLKKKAQRERQKIKDKQAKEEKKEADLYAEQRKKELLRAAEAKAADDERVAKLAVLSPRERAAMAAENRLAAQRGSAKKCDNTECMKDLKGVPFERLDYKYCNMKCLGVHRDTLEKKG